MAAALKPLVLYGHPGPNPWKVAILLEELGVPYLTQVFTTEELKKPAFLAVNRNGLAPVIDDPNTNLRLAESGAIMDYLLDQYDTEKRICFSSLEERYLLKQWLQFQCTTQGPVLQHIFHWTVFHHNSEARANYVTDFRRILKVLDDELADKQWLVGGKCSAADLSMVSFHSRIGFIMGPDAPNMVANIPTWMYGTSACWSE